MITSTTIITILRSRLYGLLLASESDPRRNALAALEKVDNDYLDDLCDHLGYELAENS